MLNLLSTDAPTGRVMLAAQVALSQCAIGHACHRYLNALEDALAIEPPPFDTMEYAEIYRESATSDAWMAVSLITNAEREGDGAKRLWSLAACSDDDAIQRSLKRHAIDESRHAILYLALLDLTFPGSVDDGFRRELNQLSPHFSHRHRLAPVPGSPYAKKPTIDDFLQMNIAEIRTAIHHLLQRPAISLHCSTSNLHRITRIQESLLRDELKHVAYTAVLIDKLADGAPQDLLPTLFRRRLRDFNQITHEELGVGVFDCSVACCAKRPQCRAKASSAAHDTMVMGPEATLTAPTPRGLPTVRVSYS